MHYIIRHGGFESAVADKDDHREHFIGIQFQGRLQGLGMFVILMQWVLEGVRAPAKLLGPEFLLGIAEYPAFIILGFNDENTMPGNDNMVDLRGPVFCRQRHIFEQRVDTPVQKEPCPQIHLAFPPHAFHETRF